MKTKKKMNIIINPPSRDNLVAFPSDLFFTIFIEIVHIIFYILLSLH